MNLCSIITFHSQHYYSNCIKYHTSQGDLKLIFSLCQLLIPTHPLHLPGFLWGLPNWLPTASLPPPLCIFHTAPQVVLLKSKSNYVTPTYNLQWLPMALGKNVNYFSWCILPSSFSRLSLTHFALATEAFLSSGPSFLPQGLCMGCYPYPESFSFSHPLPLLLPILQQAVYRTFPDHPV